MKTLFSFIAILLVTPLLVAQGAIPATNLSCQILDNAICTSTVDASGNPSYIAQGTLGSRLTITGTSWTGYIAGARQVMSGTYTDAITGLSASTFNYIYVKQDSTGTIAAADFGATILAPVYSYKAPTACTSASASAPQYWYDLSTNQWQVSTAAACSFSAASPQVIFLGVVWVTVTPTISGVAHEPYRLNPYKRYELFGDGFDAQSAGTDITKQELTSGTTVLDNWHTYTSFEMTGATVNPTILTNASNKWGGLVVYSQNPVLIVNTSVLSASSLGRGGPAAVTSTCAAASTGGLGGRGGGGGGASATNAGCAGGAAELPASFAAISGGGTLGSIAGNGSSSTLTLTANDLLLGPPYGHYIGGTGGTGGGDGGASSGGAGGASGGGIIVRAPSVIEDASSSITANGGNGGNGGGTNGGAGGGGGAGIIAIHAGFYTISGTETATKGSGGTKAGGGGNGGNGSDGIVQNVKLW